MEIGKYYTGYLERGPFFGKTLFKVLNIERRPDPMWFPGKPFGDPYINYYIVEIVGLEEDEILYYDNQPIPESYFYDVEPYNYYSGGLDNLKSLISKVFVDGTILNEGNIEHILSSLVPHDPIKHRRDEDERIAE